MKKVFVTRKIPDAGIQKLRENGCDVTVGASDRNLTKDELLVALRGKGYDAVLSLLTDHIDADVIEAAGASCKIFANYAMGFDNIDLKIAAAKNIFISNTPDVLTETVAEHTFALMLAVTHRIAEADRFTREGKYHGWEPELMLGNDLSHKTIGILGLGRIGSRVAHHAVHGFDAHVFYFDVKRNEGFESVYGATFMPTVEELLSKSDFVSIHVPLLPTTKHLINADRLRLMKKTAYLVNTSRGPVVDEAALVEALKIGVIKGAALDVFENEPKLSPGLAELPNVILTPHIASATEETRSAMAIMAAENIIAVLAGKEPPQRVIPKP